MSDLAARDLRHIWHPYTQMKDCEELPPIPVERAEGAKIFDTTGNFYYDTISSWWCNVHGHNHPHIKKAIKDQLDSFEHVLFAGFTHHPAVVLAEKLAEMTPSGLNRVFYSDNGSTSVEVAMKMSLQHWHNLGKTDKVRFVSFDHAYHGDTVGAMSVSGVDLYNEKFRPLFFDSYKVPTPYCYRCPIEKRRDDCGLECLRHMEGILKQDHEKIAALIIEPMLLGAGGMIVYPPEYLKRARELTAMYGIHLILDEVATGFGRTGKMFACEHAGVEPDLMCLSKGITSGYLPMGATLATEDIYGSFYDEYSKNKTFYHGHTYTANPLACAAAVASMELFEIEGSLREVNRINSRLKRFMNEVEGLPFVGDTRILGVVGAMELVRDKVTKERFGHGRRIGLEIYKKGLEKNLLLRPLGDIIYFFLPYCVKEAELDEIFKNTEEILRSVK